MAVLERPLSSSVTCKNLTDGAGIAGSDADGPDSQDWRVRKEVHRCEALPYWTGPDAFFLTLILLLRWIVSFSHARRGRWAHRTAGSPFSLRPLTRDYSASVHPLVFHTNFGPICFNTWDTAGQEKFGGLRDGY